LNKVSSIPHNDLKFLILLDCASTVCFFINHDLVSNIHKSEVPLYLGTNNGVNITYEQANYDGMDVWFNPKGLANVLSYGLLTNIGRVVGDSYYHSSIFYHKNGHGWIEFEKLGCGLYAFDTRRPKTNKPSFISYSLVQTVASNKSLYSDTQIKRAEGVRELFVKVGRPGKQHFRYMLGNNLLLNYPYISENDKIAEYIFGQELGTVHGRKLRSKPTSVPSIPLQKVPSALKTIHKDVRLFIDIFFINGIPFLHSISQNIGLRTAEVLPDRYIDSILSQLKKAINTYTDNGFNIKLIDADLEFSSIEFRVKIDNKLVPVNILDVDTKNHSAE